METRAQLRLLLGHSHAVFNVWRGSHLHPANGVGSHHQVIASTCPPYPQRPGVPFSSRCLSLVGLDKPRNHDADHGRNFEIATYVAILDALSICTFRQGVRSSWYCERSSHQKSRSVSRHLPVASAQAATRWMHLMKVFTWR